ncbi:ferredoxin [Streptomyces tendae]|uniref:ferredoxin n=1 Tax=Streptomyces tendae TaxID=1932 RepID=UPI0036C2AF00
MSFAGQASETAKVSAARDRRAGAGQCLLAAPAVFDQDEQDGLVRILDENPPASQSDAVREALRACPSGALALRR